MERERLSGGWRTSQVRVGALVAGALDVNGASPRRFFFEVLSHFASAPHEAERLRYFASSEGRDDLSQYNLREGGGRPASRAGRAAVSVSLPLRCTGADKGCQPDDVPFSCTRWQCRPSRQYQLTKAVLDFIVPQGAAP